MSFWESIWNYLSTSSGYSIFTSATSIILVVAMQFVAGIFMVLVNDNNQRAKTLGTVQMYVSTYVLSCFYFIVANALLFFLPLNPYGHWAAVVIYGTLALVYIHNRALGGKAEIILNDHPLKVGSGYLFGSIALFVPMFYLSKVSWQATVSAILLGVYVVVVAIKMLFCYGQLGRLAQT